VIVDVRSVPCRSSRPGPLVIQSTSRLAASATLHDVVIAVDRLAANSLGCAYINLALATKRNTLRIHHVPSADPLIAKGYVEVPADLDVARRVVAARHVRGTDDRRVRGALSDARS